MKNSPLLLASLVLIVPAGIPALAAAPTQPSPASAGKPVDCSAAYGGHTASCRLVPCSKRYLSFVGTWRGKFYAYVRSQSTPEKPVFRPYENSVRYGADDCLENSAAGESFIVGHETDRYPAFAGLPAKVETSLLIIGRGAGGKAFLRTVDEHGVNSFSLVYRNDAASLAIWKLVLPASTGNPPMTFTTIDGRNFAAANVHTRDVTITMAVGPASAPYWQGVI
ncbi:MAG TPA: hypothetical protein VFX38_06430, partial [Gammaproteobacteria bacterium]|nr:hypothetical protein [Gammaproteobacteria bacterium]